jgi:type VI secretion system secreted protein Hcp
VNQNLSRRLAGFGLPGVVAVGVACALAAASDSAAQEPGSDAVVAAPRAAAAGAAAGKTSDAVVFAKIDGIPGESADPRHPGEIDVTSFDLAVKNSASSGSGGGGGAGKADFGPVRFGKVVDAASPLLLKAVATGQHLKSATFTFARPGNKGATFETYKLEDVTVSGYEQGPAQPTAETVELDYAKITVTETPATGGAPITFGWDTQANAPV